MSLSEEDRVSLVRQFVEVTGVGDEERARFYLEAAGWQLQVALGGFYEGEEEGLPPSSVGAGAVPSDAPPPPVVTATAPVASGGGTGRGGPQTRVFGGGPMTLDALRAMMVGGVDSEDDDDDDKQAFYAGGSESSGQQVLGPSGTGGGGGGGGKKNKLDEDIIADVFKKAREHGAEEVELGRSAAAAAAAGGPGRSRGGPGGGGGLFQGAGYKLGSEETAVAAAAGATSTAPGVPSGGSSRSQQREVVLRLWRGGFTVDGGGLRSYADPANVSFLDSVKRGEVPRELIVTRGEEVSLTMEDRRGEDYVAPKNPTVPFQGKGNVLGSPCPVVSSVVSSANVGDRAANERLAREGVVLAEGAPRTNIQFRLADGSRLVGTFNHSHSVRDLHNFINTARPEYGGVSYVLTLFPSTSLTEMEATLAEANVLNAALNQKIQNL